MEKYLTEKRKGQFHIIKKPNQFFSRDTLNVYFPNDPNPLPARLVRKSIKHDVALVSIDAPDGGLPEVPLEESDKDPVLGELVTVIGYPAVAIGAYGTVNTSNPFASKDTYVPIPSPTLSTGYMGKRIDPDIETPDFSVKDVQVPTDAYLFTSNTSGAGTSGAPVFNSQGHVTGIFLADEERDGAQVAYAIPIKYGRGLFHGYKSNVD
jgi:S1-C subfamily serine protease